MVSVRAVLDMADLRLRVRAGDDLLDRPISRIYGTELPDPARFLSGGELVLSGLLWLRSEADVEPFVSALAGSAVAALVACDADTGVLPAGLVEQCRRYRVPLLETSPELSFAVITDRVGLALAGERLGLPGRERSAGRGRALVSAVASGASLTELLRLGAAALGAPCWVLAPLGRVLASSGTPLPMERRAKLIAAFLGGRRSADGASVLGFDEPGPELGRCFLVVGGSVEPGAEPAAELVDLIGVYRSRERDLRAATNRLGDTLLRAALAGTAPPGELTGLAQAAGLDAHRPLRVLAMATDFDGSLDLPVLAELVETLSATQRTGSVGGLVGGLVGEVDGRAYGMLATAREADAELAGRAAVALRMAEPGLRHGRLLLGISSVTALARLRTAAQEARYALEMAASRPGRTTVVAGSDVAVHRLLLAGAPEELRAALYRRMLGPVLDYDAEHGSGLIDTLRVFLDCSGSWSRAAARLHLHVNTLRYRISRVEELAGVDLSEFCQRVDMYLALLAGSTED